MAKAIKVARLRRTLMAYATAGAFAMGVVASLATLLPLSGRLQDSAVDGLIDTANSTAQSILALVEGRHKAIRQVTSRTQARNLLAGFNDATLDETTFREKTGAILSDAVIASPDILGVTRLALDGETAVVVGETAPASTWPTNWSSLEDVRAVGPVVTANGLRIIAAAPIRPPGGGAALGTDIVVLDSGQVCDRLGLSKMRLGGSTRVYLVYPTAAGPRLLLADGSSEPLKDRTDLPMAALTAAVAGTEPTLLEDDDLLIAAAPVGVNNWGLVVTRHADEVFAGVNHDIITVLLAVVLPLALGGAGGLYLLLRPVTGTLLIHADSLEQEVARITLGLSRAMGEAEEARHRAEAALDDLRRTQATLIQAEKMASLGGLVAGIAHEVNTPVGIVLTGASYLQKETGTLDRLYHADDLSAEDMEHYLVAAREASELILGNAHRAADLIQSFKQVAVDQTAGERRVIDMAEYVREVLTSLRPKLKRRPITVDVAVPPGLMVDTYPGALSQLLTNLIVNSLTHGYDRDDTPGRIGISIAEREGEIELVYEDDGRGIPPELRRKVFEPFFTTRRNAGGSGLGLHIVYNLATRTLGGAVRLDPAAASGCRFVIRFPRLPAAVETRN